MLSNLSFFLEKPKVVAYRELPKPEVSHSRQVLIAINYTGICGSDVHYYEEGQIGEYAMKDPLVLGHEASGTIVAVGSEVKSLQPGDRVAIEPGIPCRHCEPCLSGSYHLCPFMRFAASPPYHGTMTGFYLSDEDFCYKLPANVSTKEGALYEPLSVAVHLVRQAELRPGQSIVIMGCGPIGLLCMAVAKTFGAAKIVGVDIHLGRLEFAKSYAATHIFAPTQGSAEENAAQLLEQTELNGVIRGADAVIDATGVESSIRTSLHVVRRGGVFVQGGMGRPDISFPIMLLCMKEVNAKGSFRYNSGDYALSSHLVSSGKVDVEKLITEVVKFSEAEKALKSMKDGKNIKVLIEGPNN